MENIYYRFTSVSVEQFALLDDKLSEGERLRYKTELPFHYIKSERQLVSRCEVLVYQKEELKLKAILDCSFEIKEESVLAITREDGSVVFPAYILIQLASLCYGTLRGVLVEKTKGTSFSSIILPPLLVAEIITEDLVINNNPE